MILILGSSQPNITYFPRARPSGRAMSALERLREEAEAEGGYDLAYSGARRPSGDELDDILFPEEEDAEGDGGGDPFAGLQKFIKGFQAL